ncbi:hypothetical protein KY360_07440 [Candidatus Woesearchaeota archaeon]|nr:hypothetical protein [Candidatus Woesearchaeota archaeon]
MQLPCDACIWGIIPMIKRELVLRLVKEHGMKQVDASAKLGMTKGSVTQYLQGKRASNSNRLNKVKDIKSAIDSLAKDIAKKSVDEKEIVKRFCIICRIAQKKIKP